MKIFLTILAIIIGIGVINAASTMDARNAAYEACMATGEFSGVTCARHADDTVKGRD